MRILAIDDDPNIRRLLKLRLELKGYAVEMAESGVDVIARLKELSASQPDLVICDVYMPGMDGYSVCRQLREAGWKMPFLFLTSKGDSADKVRGIESGADDYLLKPFDPHELEAKVASHLRPR
jgi:two-component system response regulator MprA